MSENSKEPESKNTALKTAVELALTMFRKQDIPQEKNSARNDQFPERLKIQLIHIWDEIVGSFAEIMVRRDPNIFFHPARKQLCKELGKFQLTDDARTAQEDVYNYFLGEGDFLKCKQVVESIFASLDRYVRADTHVNFHGFDEIRKGVTEFNQRLAEHGVNYEFSGGKLLKLDGISEPLVSEVKHWLKDYEAAYVAFASAEEKYQKRIFTRNLLDDLRLALELFLKQALQNDKPLEKQVSEIGQFLDDCGATKEFRNMFRTMLDYYAKHQNTNVKHGDTVVGSEVEFIFDLTASFIKHIVRLKSQL